MASRVTPIGAARSAASRRMARTAADRRSMLLLLPVVLLVVIGLGSLLSASSVVALEESLDSLFYVKRQLLWLGVGGAALVITSRIPYRWYARLATPILGLGLGGLAATLVVGETRNGATSWIRVGSLTVQPSEFAKFAVVAFLAAALTRRDRRLDDFGRFIGPVVLALGATGILMVLQPDFGTLFVIMAGAAGVLVASAAPLRFVIGSLGGAAIAGLLLIRSMRHSWERIVSFRDPLADRLGSGLQAVQSLVALETGGLFGVGLGASRARWSYLPNAHTDFIFAIIGEEMGLAGTLAIVLLFLVFTVAGGVVAARAPDPFGRLLAVGIVTWITVQALVNIGGVTVTFPITGVPLPFISSGGSAMLVNLAAVGILVNIARCGSAARA